MTSFSKHATTHATTHPAPDGVAAPRSYAADALPQATIVARLATAITLLSGVWVALSPWLITLQQGGGTRVEIHEVIVGLATAAVALGRLTRPRGALEFDFAGAVLGIWLIISPFLLAISVSVNAGLYWSSIAAGAVVLVMSLAASTELADRG